MTRPLLLALALGVAATPALAQPSPTGHGSFLAGFVHPLAGLDHVLAMIGVGLWGAVLGGSARWALPTAFVAAMVAGFGLALLGLALPFVETVALASVFLFGIAVALLLRPPLASAATLAGLVGLFHGHAHGTELAGASALGYGLGFVLATALLHAAGLFIAWGYSQGVQGARLVRGLGWATMLGGLWIAGGH